jgi:paraquat-inducible protein B
VAYELSKDGKAVTLKVFVNAPYDQYVTTNTRFWNASGIDVAIDATGIKVNAESVTSIFIGGIAFETPSDTSSASRAEENRMFLLAKNRTQAMKQADVIVVSGMLYFTDSIRGLSIGSPVEFRGVTVGEVTSVNVVYDEAENDFRFPIGVRLYPGRLATMTTEGAAATTDLAVRQTRWNALTDRGLRYQLRTANLLTGQLYVALDFFPEAPKAHIDWTKTPPVLPTVMGSMTEVQETFSRLARKFEKVPLDQIGGDLRQSLRALNHMLVNADTFFKQLDTDIMPAARVALEEARRTFGTAERSLKTDAPLQQDMRETLREVSRAAQAMRVLADYLERHPEALLRGKKGQKP